ncbi:MAG: hypothetical protein FWC74_10415 [Candidatus Bathyarchaeota archaeon]|nr:hypothetical protein [Candidatus Termitimicrobium sp.]
MTEEEKLRQTWLDVKYQQIELYRQRSKVHQRKRTILTVIYVLCGICAAAPIVYLFPVGLILYEMGYAPFFDGFFLVLLSLQILWFVTNLIWKLSTHENRSSQLLTQLADQIDLELTNPNLYDMQTVRKLVAQAETRFLSNDDELFVKKELWDGLLQNIQRQMDLDDLHYKLTDIKESDVQLVHFHNPRTYPIWAMSDIPHRQGYEDSNTLEDEWAIMQALRKLFWAEKYDTLRVLQETSKVARENPVVFERYLRKKKISKKMNAFKQSYGVHYLSAAAKMRLVTFVESVLALSPTDLNEATVTLLHEKNEQIQKYTDEFWRVHRRSIKFYWFEALWLILLIPFIVAAVRLIYGGAEIEGVLVITVGAALVAFGEMALVVRQKIKLNGKKLIPPLIASLMGLRHSMCCEPEAEKYLEYYRRSFKNLEKHFIMTTSEIDSVKYVKDNLRDEKRTSNLHEAEEICDDAQRRMDTYYKMFHLYRRRCLQYGALELFMGIMLIPVWSIPFLGFGYHLGFPDLDLLLLLLITGIVSSFGMAAVRRHIRVWRFKEMYFKIYQGLSVLIVDGDLRQDPEKLNKMFRDIEQSALNAISNDPSMKLMAGTLSRVSGLKPASESHRHRLDKALEYITPSMVDYYDFDDNFIFKIVQFFRELISRK